MKCEGFTIPEAAKQLGMHRRTVFDYVTGRSTKDRCGPDSLLNKAEETALINTVLDMANKGMPLSRNNIKQIVREIANHPNYPNRTCSSKINLETGPSYKWVQRFIKSHPELVNSIGETRQNDDCVVFVERNAGGDVKLDVVKVSG